MNIIKLLDGKLGKEDLEKILTEHCDAFPQIPLEGEQRRIWFYNLIQTAYTLGFEDGFAQ